ncbi:MAG: crotonase/enoyl-CoA hydratase family protein [Candidatus Hydrogenedentota bacterium]
MSENHPEGSITTEARGHVWLMGLNRPAKYNGLTPKMFTELTDAYKELESNDELRVGILFGHGDHFTAGLDLPKFREYMKRGERAFDQSEVDIYGQQNKLSKPLITAVHGITYTAGIEMALAGDIIIAARGARFSQLEPLRGVMATGGATFRFVERCGWGNAMLHLLTSDEFSAEEALRIGLVQELVEPGEQLNRAVELAEKIAQGAPQAVYATKASSMTYAESGEAACIAEFAKIQKRLANTEDAEEGVSAFKERRSPVFKGV